MQGCTFCWFRDRETVVSRVVFSLYEEFQVLFVSAELTGDGIDYRFKDEKKNDGITKIVSLLVGGQPLQGFTVFFPVITQDF